MSQHSAKVGDRFYSLGCIATVTKVGRKYAHLRVFQTSTMATWEKKQPLPIPRDWERLDGESP